MFANPVAGRILPAGTPFQLGRFRVTATFGQLDADHPTPHQGTDIGNGTSGAPILAVADGTVSFAGLIGQANVVRISHPLLGPYESGYAHLDTIKVQRGQQVQRGDVIGTLGSSGATAAHLHLGCKLSGHEIDIWPLLDQQESDMLQGTPIQQIVNRQTTVLNDGTRFRPSPGTTQPELVKLAAKTLFYPEWLVDGGLALGSTRWYGAWQNTPTGIEFGYVSEKLLAPLTPIETVPVKVDCSEAVESAELLLRARVQAALLP